MNGKSSLNCLMVVFVILGSVPEIYADIVNFDNDRSFFEDEENAGRLRVGAAWGIPGLYSEDSLNIVIGVSSASSVFLGTSGQFMTVEGGGDVGIGTTDPSWKLHVLTESTGVDGIMVQKNGGGWIAQMPSMGPGGFNPITQQNDTGIIFSGGTLNTGGLTIAPWSDQNKGMRMDAQGNLGIGTATPRAHLDVGAYISNGVLGTVLGRLPEGDSSGDGTYLGVRGYSTQNESYEGLGFALEHHFYGSLNSSINFYRGGGMNGGFITFTTSDGTERVGFAGNGNVGIGTTTPDNKLDVKGTIRAEEVIVETGWADYVFEDEYELRSLSEVESHIREHGHLPGIPTASEIALSGISLGDSQRMLLEKIEELTLYAIDKERKLVALEERLEKLERLILEKL